MFIGTAPDGPFVAENPDNRGLAQAPILGQEHTDFLPRASARGSRHELVVAQEGPQMASRDGSLGRSIPLEVPPGTVKPSAMAHGSAAAAGGLFVEATAEVAGLLPAGCTDSGGHSTAPIEAVLVTPASPPLIIPSPAAQSL